jgi:hypothetical protein
MLPLVPRAARRFGLLLVAAGELEIVSAPGRGAVRRRPAGVLIV